MDLGTTTFLSRDELAQFKPNFQKLQLVQTETYNEVELAKSINVIGKEICGSIAIQLAIVGYGNKTYGVVKVDGKEINVKEFCLSNNIDIKAEQFTKLKPQTVTPRRLIRFYRFTIVDFLKEHKEVQSYLYKKILYGKNRRK